MRRRRFSRTNIAGPRASLDGQKRTALLNVRATPDQYLRWRHAADRAGRSLSAWVAEWLDELAGVPAQVLPILDRLAPSFGGRVPMQVLELELWRRWGWSAQDFYRALCRLAELELVVLVAGDAHSSVERLAAADAPRDPGGRLVTHVAARSAPGRARASRSCNSKNLDGRPGRLVERASV